jgi:hypothetical protein
MAKGALVDWYEGGKKCRLYTITWEDFLIDGNYVENMDEVAWVVDGKRIGRAKELLAFVKQCAKENDLVIQILEPLDWRPTKFVDPGLTLGSLDGLDNWKGSRVYQITPLRQGEREGSSERGQGAKS